MEAGTPPLLAGKVSRDLKYEATENPAMRHEDAYGRTLEIFSKFFMVCVKVVVMLVYLSDMGHLMTKIEAPVRLMSLVS